MSARRHRAARCSAALALAAALVLAGCDSSDDDGDDGGNGGEPGPEPGGETASTFADVIALGATDDPIALDGEALAADLESVFGTVTDDPKAVDDEDTIDTLAKRTVRRQSAD